jgi:hypothetical protein
MKLLPNTYLGKDITDRVDEKNGLFLVSKAGSRTRTREVVITQIPEGEEDLLEGDFVRIFHKDPTYRDGDSIFFKRDQIITWSAPHEA